ncbi:uncharacterized protein V6R79_006748 [Siganus canaliculatus]
MNRRRMDAERVRVFHPDNRSRKLVLIVILQSVLVAACLGVTLYVLWGVQTPDDVHIQFVPMADIRRNRTLTLGAIHSSNMMGMVDDKNDAFYTNCTGPYVLYVEVCYECRLGMEAAGTLQLQVVERKEEGEKITHTSSVDLPRLPDGCEEKGVCKRLHTMAYLKVQEEASLHLYGTNGLSIKSITVGLNYLLGRYKNQTREKLWTIRNDVKNVLERDKPLTGWLNVKRHHTCIWAGPKPDGTEKQQRLSPLYSPAHAIVQQGEKQNSTLIKSPISVECFGMLVSYLSICLQETTELRDALKVKAVCNLTQSDVYRCDIFTADKAASYVIDGWMKFSHVTNKDVTLLQTFREQEMVVQNVPVDKPDIFFFSRVKLVNGIRISIKSDHACTDSLFHIYELQRLP